MAGLDVAVGAYRVSNSELVLVGHCGVGYKGL